MRSLVVTTPSFFSSSSFFLLFYSSSLFFFFSSCLFLFSSSSLLLAPCPLFSLQSSLTDCHHLLCHRHTAGPLSLSQAACSAWSNLDWFVWPWACTHRLTSCYTQHYRQTPHMCLHCSPLHSCCWHQPSSALPKALQVGPALPLLSLYRACAEL